MLDKAVKESLFALTIGICITLMVVNILMFFFYPHTMLCFAVALMMAVFGLFAILLGGNE